MQSPKMWPIEKRDGKSGSPVDLRQTMQEMQTMYDIVRVPVPRDVTMLKAAVLPMLMREIMTASPEMTRMALTGASTAGWICTGVCQVYINIDGASLRYRNDKA
jgi:hypothetical protein